jgi:hypothetical protein
VIRRVLAMRGTVAEWWRAFSAKAWWGRYAGSVAFVALIVLATVGFFRIEAVASNAEEAASDAERASESAQRANRRQDAEQAERRSQACVVFERTYREDRRSYRLDRRDLRVTLRYLANVPPAEAGTQLNVAIRAGVVRQRRDLEQTRKAVRAKRPPPYCDLPGVGLTAPGETDRRSPRRPPERSEPPRTREPLPPAAVIVVPLPR